MTEQEILQAATPGTPLHAILSRYESDQRKIAALTEAIELALNVGGLGHSGSGVFDRDEFYCEMCNSHHEHWALIVNTPDCKIWLIRKALCDAIGNEEMAGFYIEQSGTRRHTSDCSTSNAPAEVPAPCDCADAIAESDAALALVQP